MAKTTKKLLSLGLALIITVIAIFAYWHYNEYHPSTEDAYIQSHITFIASQVNGPVDTIKITNNQVVRKDQLLFTIDPTPFQLNLAKATAELELTKQQIQGSQDAISSAEAKIAEAKAELELTQKNSHRILSLVADKRASLAEGDAAKAKLAIAKATLSAAESKLRELKQKLGRTGNSNASIQAATIIKNQAALDLSHTQIKAPTAGIITNFKLRAGTMIEAGRTLFAIVEQNNWWVDANYKETDLTRIRPGQNAEVILDIYPDHKFKGKVQSISSSSGATFSLLPPENATGNWVKVTQRFPVKVKIIDPDPNFPLRVGASAKVTIDTIK